MSFILLGILNSQASGAGASTNVAGYVAAGGGGITSIEKLSFADDTISTLAANLSVGGSTRGGFQDANVAGYIAGNRENATTNVDKIAFPGDTRTTLGTGLSQGRPTSDFSNNGVAGYAAGGGTNTNEGNAVTTVDKFAFPSDARTTLGTGLSSARTQGWGFNNDAVAGYHAGGIVTDGGTIVTTVDKFAFPDDTRTTLATGLSSSKRIGSGFNNAGVAGYVAGGLSGSGNVSTVDKFAFPSDSRSTLATGLSGSRNGTQDFNNSAVAGYVAGGESAGALTTVDKFAFPDDTRSTLATGLSTARESGAGFNDGN